MRDIQATIAQLPKPALEMLRAPTYERSSLDDRRSRVALAVESMRHHMTDEGWQIMDGLGQSGYILSGHELDGLVQVGQILDTYDPGIVLMQDKREWDTFNGDFREPKARFLNVDLLQTRRDVFKLTILKDAHQKPLYHRDSAAEIGCHAWVIYYHPQIVRQVAPYVRPQHLIRTYHSIDPALVPPYSAERSGCLLSGAVSGVYPLRQRLIEGIHSLPETTYVRHPGYHRKGCCTPEYLKILSHYKVAICTSSIYGYALRKIIEATACGCIVLTDLPADEVLPHIDGNLVRVDPNTGVRTAASMIRGLINSYNPARQQQFAEAAVRWYDYRQVTSRLSQDITMLQLNYSDN